jgi:hypothetical protein
MVVQPQNHIEKVINYRWWLASNYGNFDVFRFCRNYFISIIETMQSMQMLPFIRCTTMGNKTEQLIDIDVQGDFPYNGTMERMETATEICVRNRFHVSIARMGHRQLKSI